MFDILNNIQISVTYNFSTITDDDITYQYINVNTDINQLASQQPTPTFAYGNSDENNSNSNSRHIPSHTNITHPETHILSLPLCNPYIYSISTSPFSWISLQINCSQLYFNSKKSYLFSDIASMNELHWKHFISFLTYCYTQNNINNDKKYTKNINKRNINSILFEYHYVHNKKFENMLTYSTAIKSNIFNTLKVFIKHCNKYGGLLIPQNLDNQHLQNHRIAIDSNNMIMKRIYLCLQIY